MYTTNSLLTDHQKKPPHRIIDRNPYQDLVVKKIVVKFFFLHFILQIIY